MVPPGTHVIYIYFLTALVLLDPFYSLMNFSISFSIFAKKPAEILIVIADQLGRTDILTILRFLIYENGPPICLFRSSLISLGKKLFLVVSHMQVLHTVTKF